MLLWGVLTFWASKTKPQWMSSLPIWCVCSCERVNTRSRSFPYIRCSCICVWMLNTVLAKRLFLLQIYLLFITISTNYFNLFLLFQILAGAQKMAPSLPCWYHSKFHICLCQPKNSIHWLFGCSFFLISCASSDANHSHKHFRKTLLQSKRRKRKWRQRQKKKKKETKTSAESEP